MNLQQTAAELETIYLAYRSLASAAVRGQEAMLGGRLLLITGQNASSAHRAMAGRIAGAATLIVLEEASAAKAALRSGACDFLVSSLDEALRILKNELRRRASVTVGLQGASSGVLADCIERGVQPDLLEEPSAVLEDRGARCVRWRAALAEGEYGVCWSLHGDLMLHTGLDAMAREAICTDAVDRLRWLQASPAILGRRWQRFRFLPMIAIELHRLREHASALPVTFEVKGGSSSRLRGGLGEDRAP